MLMRSMNCFTSTFLNGGYGILNSSEISCRNKSNLCNSICKLTIVRVCSRRLRVLGCIADGEES